MHSDRISISILIIILIPLLFSCEKLNKENRSFLSFSDDTIYFDTVFATVGSTTRELRIRNELDSRIVLDEISLAGGTSSQFRLNIDGVPSAKMTNIEIDRGDSLYIFIDVFVDPANSDSPVAVTDSILFSFSGKTMKVQLLAWGQDVILLENKVIGSELWTAARPYLVYGNVTVDTLETLTLEAGSRIYFHKNATLTLAGNIIAGGTMDLPVLFATDRTEQMYDDVPGMWNGIFILNTSKGNRLTNIRLRNSVNGICIGEVSSAQSDPDLKMFNSTVSHSTISGLSVINGNVQAVNSVFSHCGKYCVSIRAGGTYSFTHCTVFNIWDYGYRLTPSLYISEKPAVTGGFSSQLYLDVSNSVIYGDLNSEIVIIPSSKNYSGNYFFDNCLVKLDTLKSGFWSRESFPGTIVNKNPKFIDYVTWDFRPDTLSPLIDSGNPLYIVDTPLDIRGVSRLTDGLPDAGAYERVPGEKKKQN